MITVSNYVIVDHPHLPLFHDEDAVICWDRGAYAESISAEQFQDASHVIAVFGEERRPTVFELHFQTSGVSRHITMRVPSFSALPAAVIGTDRVAVMHRRHAQSFSALYPITCHPLPISGPGVSEVVQWHRLRDKDPGARWLLELLMDEARKLNEHGP